MLIKKAEEGFGRLLTPLQPLSLTPINKKFTDFFLKPAKKFAGGVNGISAFIFICNLGSEFTRYAFPFIGCLSTCVVEMKRCDALERTFRMEDAVPMFVYNIAYTN